MKKKYHGWRVERSATWFQKLISDTGILQLPL